MLTFLRNIPFLVKFHVTHQSIIFSQKFWLSSETFTFPQNLWHDVCPFRLSPKISFFSKFMTSMFTSIWTKLFQQFTVNRPQNCLNLNRKVVFKNIHSQKITFFITSLFSRAQIRTCWDQPLRQHRMASTCQKLQHTDSTLPKAAVHVNDDDYILLQHA